MLDLQSEKKMNEKQASILVVDDHPMFRLGLKEFLQPHVSHNVIEAMSQQEANIAFRSCQVDLAIVDIVLEDGSGLELIRHQKSQHKDTRWLVLSMFTDMFHQARARQAGAHGFLGKRVVQAELLDAVKALLSGRDYPAGWEQLTAGKYSDKTDQEMLQMLSERELTVFRLISEGYTVEEIAKSLSRSRKTINAIRDRIRAKLGIGSSAQLNRFATQWFFSQAEEAPPPMKFKRKPSDTQSIKDQSDDDDSGDPGEPGEPGNQIPI